MSYTIAGAKVWNGSNWVDAAGNGAQPLEASGGTEVTDGGYKYHIFKSSGTLTVSKEGLCDLLVVGGGGGGGSNDNHGGGAGGAGEMYEVFDMFIPEGGATVTIGAGMAGSSSHNSNQGNPSRIRNITASAGGAGGGADFPGGSGPGAGGTCQKNVVPKSIGLGGNGGRSEVNDGNRRGGGGGGGGVDGQNATPYNGGNGTASSVVPSAIASAQSIGEVSGDDVYFSGGGGGGSNGGSTQSGGLGGGGNGGQTSRQNGSANTGGGGGGVGKSVTAGSGGSGVVVVRYLI